MSQAKKRLVYRPRDEGSKRFKRGVSTEQERAGTTAVQTQQQELSPATGAMSLQCAEVRATPSWHDGYRSRWYPSLFRRKTNPMNPAKHDEQNKQDAGVFAVCRGATINEYSEGAGCVSCPVPLSRRVHCIAIFLFDGTVLPWVALPPAADSCTRTPRRLPKDQDDKSLADAPAAGRSVSALRAP